VSRRRIAAAVIVGLVAVFVVVGFALGRFDPISIDRHWTGSPLPPCFVSSAQCYVHVLGTDGLGRDLLARLLFGSVSTIGFALNALVFAVILGFGVALISRVPSPLGRFVVERFMVATECFPPLAFILIMILVGRQDRFATLSGIAIAALVGLLFYPRIARAVITAPTARGALVAASDRGARALTGIVALLATVDFLGYGVQPPSPSLGNILNDAQMDAAIAWWAMVFPAIWLIGALLVIEVLRRLLVGGPRTAYDQESLV